jgi:hypothetical protein
MSTAAVEKAFYRHPAFFPQRILGATGISTFWVKNLLVTLFFVVSLTACAWLDGSFFLRQNGYGYFEHPGIVGWYLILLIMPVSIHKLILKAVDNKPAYNQLEISGSIFDFVRDVRQPTQEFIGLRTPLSRSVYSLLFCAGFAGFAWNTYQNLYPGTLAPLDFWDSVHFRYGYFGTRVFKFYMDALLLPSIAHIFAGIIWSNGVAIDKLMKRNAVRIAPFSADHCGGFAFLSDLILSPAVTALLISGLAFFGDVYTHRALYVSTLMGLVVVLSVLTFSYIIPTLFIRTALSKLKEVERREIYARQEIFYRQVLLRNLKGAELRDAAEYLRYFDEAIKKIDDIRNWPHLSKISGAFGFAVIPTLISPALSLASLLTRVWTSPP